MKKKNVKMWMQNLHLNVLVIHLSSQQRKKQETDKRKLVIMYSMPNPNHNANPLKSVLRLNNNQRRFYWVASMAIPVGKWVGFVCFIITIFYFRVGKSLAWHSPGKWRLSA